jgi:hypothetical protein
MSTSTPTLHTGNPSSETENAQHTSFIIASYPHILLLSLFTLPSSSTPTFTTSPDIQNSINEIFAILAISESFIASNFPEAIGTPLQFM